MCMVVLYVILFSIVCLVWVTAALIITVTLTGIQIFHLNNRLGVTIRMHFRYVHILNS